MSADQSEPETLFIRLRGRIQGPFSTEQLQALHQRGQFSRAHEVSNDRVSWRSATSLSNVFVAPKIRPFPPQKAAPRLDPEDEPDEIVAELAQKNLGFLVPGSAKMVKPVWHYSVGKETYGPVTVLELRGLLAGGQLMGSDLVWKDGLADWAPAAEVPELSGSADPRSPYSSRGGRGGTNYCVACGNAMDSRAEICPQCGVRQLAQVAPKSRMITALLAIFLGSWGIHRFYLGQGLLGLAYTFTWGMFMFAGFWFLAGRVPVVGVICIIASGLPTVFAFVEGVVFLCMSDASFARHYNSR